jgi:hypothetical protein
VTCFPNTKTKKGFRVKTSKDLNEVPQVPLSTPDNLDLPQGNSANWPTSPSPNDAGLINSQGLIDGIALLGTLAKIVMQARENMAITEKLIEERMRKI